MQCPAGDVAILRAGPRRAYSRAVMLALQPGIHAMRVGCVALLFLSTSACATGLRQPQPQRGSVTVGVTTSGGAVATMTFRVTIEPAGINGTVSADAGVWTRNDVPLGNHVVRLLDVPARCRVDGAAERPITISQQRRRAVLRFQIVCP